MLGVEKDDFVICQSLTFAASANPIIYLGGIPVFVDSEKDTWNLCPNAVEDAIKFVLKRQKTKSHYYGLPLWNAL
jgi:dTDP-4-amino-4,6-dideoxygalactose transaminase